MCVWCRSILFYTLQHNFHLGLLFFFVSFFLTFSDSNFHILSFLPVIVPVRYTICTHEEFRRKHLKSLPVFTPAVFTKRYLYYQHNIHLFMHIICMHVEIKRERFSTYAKSAALMSSSFTLFPHQCLLLPYMLYIPVLLVCLLTTIFETHCVQHFSSLCVSIYADSTHQRKIKGHFVLFLFPTS